MPKGSSGEGCNTAEKATRERVHALCTGTGARPRGQGRCMLGGSFVRMPLAGSSQRCACG